MSINIYYDHKNYRIRNTKKIKSFIVRIIGSENKRPGDLSFILTSDDSLLEINRKFLKHDYMTDVISFDYSSESIVNGEIYLSIDTIRRNAERYGSDMTDEVIRVMFHGLLHLCGYNDKGKEEREIMHEMQEKRLKEYKEYLNEI